ncbi:MAG TPA: hypothetical protein VF910_01105 [Candidatus Bathyarchaeia archaeon]
MSQPNDWLKERMEPEREQVREYALAGAHHQYRQWMRWQNRPESEVRYLPNEHSLQGAPRGGILWRLGTWGRRRDAGYLMEHALYLGLEIRDVDY